MHIQASGRTATGGQANGVMGETSPALGKRSWETPTCASFGSVNQATKEISYMTGDGIENLPDPT